MAEVVTVGCLLVRLPPDARPICRLAIDVRRGAPHAPGMRAGVEPERIVAGVLLLLVAVVAATAGGLGVLVSPIMGFAEPDAQSSLLTSVAALWGLAAALTVLAVFVLAGRHSRAALALAAAIMAAASASLGIGRDPAALPLLGVALTEAGALLIGAVRLRR